MDGTQLYHLSYPFLGHNRHNANARNLQKKVNKCQSVPLLRIEHYCVLWTLCDLGLGLFKYCAKRLEYPHVLQLWLLHGQLFNTPYSLLLDQLHKHNNLAHEVHQQFTEGPGTRDRPPE